MISIARVTKGQSEAAIILGIRNRLEMWNRNVVLDKSLFDELCSPTSFVCYLVSRKRHISVLSYFAVCYEKYQSMFASYVDFKGIYISHYSFTEGNGVRLSKTLLNRRGSDSNVKQQPNISHTPTLHLTNLKNCKQQKFC